VWPVAEQPRYVMNKLPLYLELGKPRILSMVLVTTTLGFFLGGRGVASLPLFLLTLCGVGSATGGAAMLNNYLERNSDAKMSRTRGRALPAGLIEPSRALMAGVGLVLFGVMLLAGAVNLLSGFLVLLAAFLYVLVYTPMKKMSWLNTTFGAIPGAIPPMAGWVAATGRIDPGAWVLFAILFAWQHPHFFAIAWIFRDDYRAAGFKMLPVVEPDGKATFRQTLLFSVLLIGVSLLPTAMGMTGMVYFWGALLIGLAMLGVAIYFAERQRTVDARSLLKASVLYLPLLLLFILLDAA
jgi:heme o synthase